MQENSVRAKQARQELAETEDRKQRTIEQADEEARLVAERASREAAATLSRAEQEAKALAQRRLEAAEQALELERGKAAWQRLEAILSQAPSVQDDGTRASLQPGWLEYRQISFCYQVDRAFFADIMGLPIALPQYLPAAASSFDGNRQQLVQCFFV